MHRNTPSRAVFTHLVAGLKGAGRLAAPGAPRVRSALGAVLAVALTALLGLVGVPVLAQENLEEEAPPALPPGVPKLEDLMQQPIRIVSKFEQQTTEAPASVTIITADEIRKQGHRTLADVLRSVPGLHVSYDRTYSFLGVRGFNRGDVNSLNSRILLLVDGHRVNNSLNDGAMLGTEFLLDVDLIERVEVIRGPSSVLYGNHAFFGIINVVTKNGGQYEHGEVSGEYGSFDSFKGRVTLGHQWRSGLELLLSGTFYASDGPDFEVPRLNEDQYQQFFGKLRYRDLTLQGAFSSREKGNPTAQFLSATNDPRLRVVDERGYANLRYQHDFADWFEVTAQVYYDRNEFRIGLPTEGNPVLLQEYGMGEWWGAELQLTRRFLERHTVTAGAEYRDDFRQRLYQTSDPSLPPSFQREGHTENYGVYLHGDFLVVTNLHLNAGIRYDQYGDLAATWNPRLALIWNPYARSTFKAIYGTAFRAPNFVEKILAYPAEGLSPETIRSYELVYEQGIGSHLRASAAGFFNQIDDLINFQSGSFKNQDAQALGCEVGLEAFWASGWRGRVSYTYQHATDRATSEILTDAPRHLPKLSLVAPLYRQKIFAGLEYQFVSARTTLQLDGNGPATIPGEMAGGYSVVNLTLFSRELVKGLEASASLYNVFDTRYADPATSHHRQALIPQDGRTFRIKLQYRF